MFKKLKNLLPKPASKMARLLQVAAILLVVVTVFYLSGAVVSKIIDNRRLAVEKEYQNTIESADDLILQQQFDEAILLWEEFLAKQMPQEYRYNGTLHIANVYMNAGKYQEAQQKFIDAEPDAANEEQVYVVQQGIAQSSEALGDKDTAIEYYRKLIEYLRISDRPFSVQDIGVYEQRLDRLGAHE